MEAAYRQAVALAILVAGALASGACESSISGVPDAAPGAADAQLPDAEPVPFLGFDIDVVTRFVPGNGSELEVWIDDHAGACCEPRPSFPVVGGCAMFGDTVSCSCPTPWRCLSEARVEQGGNALATLDLNASGSEIMIATGGLEIVPGTPAELVLVGCVGETRIPLHQGLAPPVLTRADFPGPTFTLELDVPPTTDSVYGGESFFFGTQLCRRTEHSLTSASPGPGRHRYVLDAMDAPTAISTPLGPVRTYGSGRLRVEAWLAEAIPGGFSLPNDRPLLVDFDTGSGTVPTALNLVTEAVLASPSDTFPKLLSAEVGPRFEKLRYEAGATTDRLVIQVNGVLFAASFPHKTPSNPLDIGLGAGKDGFFSVELGPVNLQPVDSPIDQVKHFDSFVLRWATDLVVLPTSP